MVRIKGQVEKGYTQTDGPFARRELGLQIELQYGTPERLVEIAKGRLLATRVTRWGQYKPQVRVHDGKLEAFWQFRATPINAALFEVRAREAVGEVLAILRGEL